MIPDLAIDHRIDFDVVKIYNFTVMYMGDLKTNVQVVFQNGKFKECKIPPHLLDGTQSSWDLINFISGRIDSFKQMEMVQNETK